MGLKGIEEVPPDTGSVPQCLALGAALGLIFGLMLGSVAWGVIAGTALGSISGSILDSQKDKGGSSTSEAGLPG